MHHSCILILSFEGTQTRIWRLPFAVNVTFNLSIVDPVTSKLVITHHGRGKDQFNSFMKGLQKDKESSFYQPIKKNKISFFKQEEVATGSKEKVRTEGELPCFPYSLFPFKAGRVICTIFSALESVPAFHLPQCQCKTAILPIISTCFEKRTFLRSTM